MKAEKAEVFPRFIGECGFGRDWGKSVRFRMLHDIVDDKAPFVPLRVEMGKSAAVSGGFFTGIDEGAGYHRFWDLSPQALTGTDQRRPPRNLVSSPMRQIHLHLVSDATGETVTGLARACMVQFEGVDIVQHDWWLIRSRPQVERVIAGLEADPGIVLFTLVDNAVRKHLEEACHRLQMPCISVLDPVMAALGNYLQVEMRATPGRQYQLDAGYFARIDAMHFTLAHDDGQMLDDIDNADIVLVGVSRSSKTPTCMYLAYRGLKCANYPLVPSVPLPAVLIAAKRPLIVGLTRDARSLSDIRRARLKFLNQTEDSDYAALDKVHEEVQEARRLFTRMNWPVVDVTRRSIEEASAAIVQLHQDRLLERGRKS